MSRCDILIRGGAVIDGSGAEPFHADVAIAGDRIVAVGAEASRADAAQTIDAEGLVVAPGFIDIKTHSDFTLPLNPRAESKIRQGVTTEVIGHCGFSVAPALPGKAGLLRDYLSPSAPWLSFVDTSFGNYLDGFPATSTNVCPLVGHNTLRLMTMGLKPRAANEAEIAAMAALLDRRGLCRRGLVMALSDVLPVIFPFASPVQAAVASATGILMAVILVRKAMPPMLPRRGPRKSDAWKVALIVLAGFLAAWSVANAALALRLI